MSGSHRDLILETMAHLLEQAGHESPGAAPPTFTISLYPWHHGTMAVRLAGALRNSPWWRHVDRWREVSYRGIETMMADNHVFAEYVEFLAARGYHLREVVQEKTVPVKAGECFDQEGRLAALGYLPNDEIVMPLRVLLEFEATGGASSEAK